MTTTMTTTMRILIANRGEIARRVIRTAHHLGHETVAAFADPDAAAPFVAEATASTRLGPADLSASYLSPDALLDAAKRTGATAVHPGYGFLSENAGFARAVIEAGLTWVGPNPDAIARMGSKIEARRLASSAGVPIIPGFDASQDPAELAAAADRIGYPVLVKAAAGGGGKGIRIVHDPSGFAAALAEATTEAERSFGDGSMIVERYVQRPRHVEVQIVGDRHGSVIELGTRECSVQRRYQKVLEEAPAPNLPDATRHGLRTSAVELARSIGYDSAGTVEYVVDDETGDYFFLEMNTRLQVEHPVTEHVTGLDLVELQLRVADGEPLPLAQGDVTLAGHAFEARINAEDATAGFAPQIGTITALDVPPGVRWDSGIVAGSEITPHYDSMVAKLVVGGSDRAVARRRLARALDELLVAVVVTNAGFHRWLIDQEPVVDGRITTRFLDEAALPDAPEVEDAAELAALAWEAARRSGSTDGPWAALGTFRLVPHRPTRAVVLVDHTGTAHEIVTVGSARIDGRHLVIDDDGVTRRHVVAVDVDARRVAVVVDGHTHAFDVPTRSEHWAPAADAGHGHANAIVAPFPAVVTEVSAAPGDAVSGGQVLVVIEAMKMLHSLAAAGPGTVDEVRVAVGDQLASDQILVTFSTPDQES
ncbi:MAG: biotin carboxylase N-terminal domain-containing protein [Actinomycetota bacterium]